MLSGLRSALLQPVSGASLAVARMAFGVTVVVEVGRYVYHDWIWAYYVEPVLRLTYYGWGWVPAASYPVLLVVFGLLAAAGAALALGYRTRLAATATALLLGYVFLLEQGRYLNHIYLMVVLAALFALLPSGGAWSLDRWRQSKAWRGAIPAWGLRAFQTQLALVYTTAAVAKINGDWLRGEPIGMWLEPTLAGSPLAVLLGWEPWPLLFAWGGLALDLLAVPALFWRRTRVLAVAALVSFHLFNAWAFEIGVFPWLMIALTPVFFAPDWPERLLARFRGRTQRQRDPVPEALAVPVRPGPVLLAALVAFASVQVGLPLRHWAYPGDVAWTEEGHLYAWRMKLRTKRATTAEFVVVTERSSWTVDPAEWLTEWQARKAPVRPDLLHQVALWIADGVRADGHRDVRVYARVEVQLNDRPPQALVDPTVDLAAEPRSWRPASWILPLGREGDAPRLADFPRPDAVALAQRP